MQTPQGTEQHLHIVIADPSKPPGHGPGHEVNDVDVGNIRGPMGPAINVQGPLPQDQTNPPSNPKPGDAYILSPPADANNHQIPSWIPTYTPPGGQPRHEHGDFIFWDGTAWHNGGDVQGPEGPPGPKGDSGDVFWLRSGDGVDGQDGHLYRTDFPTPTVPQFGGLAPVGWTDLGRTRGETGPTGPTGPIGPTGDTGPAPLFTPTVHGLAPGTGPTSTTTGTGEPNDPMTLDIGIPQGAQGRGADWCYGRDGTRTDALGACVTGMLPAGRSRPRHGPIVRKGSSSLSEFLTARLARLARQARQETSARQDLSQQSVLRTSHRPARRPDWTGCADDLGDRCSR